MSAPVQTSSTSTESIVARAIREGRDDRLVEMIEHAQAEGGIAAEGLFAALRDTPSRLVRNAAALAIADMRPPRGVEVLADVLARPSIAHEAGTLIYALDELGGSLPLPAFVTLLEHGSYEARSEALILLDNGRVVARSEDERDMARDRLAALASSGRAEAAEALADWPGRWSR